MALLELTDGISKSIDERKLTVGIFLDLAKAFDTVNHKILLDKLQYYGIRGTPLKWFADYLTDRKQYVVINKNYSSMLTVKCGVPQGSVLGPLLFILYVNDLQSATSLKLIMFADDTNIFATGTDLPKLTNTINDELTTINHWFSANLLSLNLQKSNYMIFGNRKKYDAGYEISINNVKLPCVHETKFLGVIINDRLKWNNHIDMIETKISKVVGILRRASYVLALDSLKLLYHTLLEPYLTYCCIVWASPHEMPGLDRKLKLQKRAVRIITGSPYRAHSTPLFAQLGILKIHDLSYTYLMLFMFKFKHNILPPLFENYFTLVSNTHTLNTRSSHRYAVPFARTTCRYNCLRIIGPRLWNSLPSRYFK